MTDRSDGKQMPPWLRGVPLPPRPPEAAVELRPASPSAPASPAFGSTDPGGIPDWLSELADSTTPSSTDSSLSPLPPEPAQDLPAWLANLGGSIDPVESSTASADSDEDIPAWLRTSEPSSPASPPAPPSSGRLSSASGFTGWLSTGAESDTPSSVPPVPTPASPPIKETRAAEELPAWLSSQVNSGDGNDQGDEPLPDWLQSLEPQPADRSSETLPAPPSWMNEPAPRSPEVRVQPPAETSTPSWLQSSVPSTPPEPTADDADDGLPSWLQSISDDDIRRVTESDDNDLGVAPFSFGSEPGTPAASEAPGWLSSLPDQGEQRPSGEASEWLGASASQLIQAKTPNTPDVPEWLREATPDQSDDDAPAWLRGPESPTTSASEPTMSPGSAAEDVPAWLRDAARPLPEEAQSPQSDELPAWLREGGPQLATPPSPNLLPLNIVDTADEQAFGQPAQPAWVSDVSASSAPSPVPTADALPDWLQSDTPIYPPNTGNTLVPPVASANDELPAWLRDTAAPTVDPNASSLPPWLRDEAGQPMPSAMAPGDINLPTWLRGTDSSSPATPSSAAASVVPQSTSNLDWFEDTGKPANLTPSSELLGGADLPAWLRSETERPRESNAADARSLDWLARLGAYDDDTPAVATVNMAAPRLMLPAAPTRTPTQIEALALLRRMASTPLPQAAVVGETAPATPLGRMNIERALSLLLLILLIVGLAVPGLATTVVGMDSAPSPAAAALLEQIKPLGASDIVLIGYEWDAQRMSELRPLERAVIDQLIAQRVKLVLVSTDPQGTMLQFDLRDRLNAAKYEGGGLDYVLLGYRPGGEIGLRQLAQNLRGALQSDFQGRDATIGALATNLSTSEPRLSTLNDFAMAIVFADEPTDVQGWMEQIRPTMKKPIAFLVPAGVQPISQPYFRQPGIFSLAGIQGALAYEQLRGGADTTQTMLQTSQLRLATLLFCALLVIGLMIVLARSAINRPRSQP